MRRREVGGKLAKDEQIYFDNDADVVKIPQESTVKVPQPHKRQ